LWQEHAQSQPVSKIRKSFTCLLDTLTARNGLVAYIPIIFVTICMFCGASWQIFLHNNDPARYQCYALMFWFGSGATALLPATQCKFFHEFLPPGLQPPFHILPLEYPPLTLLPFSLALLAPQPYYQLAFAFLMSLTSVLIYWLLLRYAPRGGALIFALYLLIGAVATAQARFDLIPAALTLLCIIAAERKYWTAAYIALAFGTLIKLYPILLLPALFIAEQQAHGHIHILPQQLSISSIVLQLWRTLRGAIQWRWKNCLVFFAILLSVTGIFALLNFKGAFISQLSYFMLRPVQVEATGSTLLWIAGYLGTPLQIVYTYGSLNIVSPPGGIISLVGSACMALGFLFALWMQWQGKLDIAQISIALLFVFIATGKVFSTQYLIWLIPLLAYTGAFDTFWLLLWGAISLLTTYIQTYFYTRPVDSLLIPHTSGFFESVTLRNALFILVALAYLFNWFRIRRRKPIPTLHGYL
jgi:hypothetical protein